MELTAAPIQTAPHELKISSWGDLVVEHEAERFKLGLELLKNHMVGRPGSRNDVAVVHLGGNKAQFLAKERSWRAVNNAHWRHSQLLQGPLPAGLQG